MSQFEIYGLYEDQMESLSEKFGDAVLDKNKEEGTMTLDLSPLSAESLVHEGYNLTPL